jgi:SAM-dependent methyltransferase
MPLAFHADRSEKFRQQHVNARDYIVPFIEQVVPFKDLRVLEIGCGEGGILKACLEQGATVVGVDLSEPKIAFANEAFAEYVAEGRAVFLAADIYEEGFMERFAGTFDLVIMKDTIEHVFGHERILRRVQGFLADNGVLFVGFPPWYMPYGGHQQMAVSRIGKLPYYHLLPRKVYKKLLERFGEPEVRVEELLEIHDTRLTISQFERYLDMCGYETLKRQFFLVNPIYSAKFGLKPRRQLPLIRSLPFVRDFITTTCYYIVKPSAKK